MDLLKEEDIVYKLVGPVLMTVELQDSKDNVGKRLEFIEAEIKKLDTAIGIFKFVLSYFRHNDLICHIYVQFIANKQGEQTKIGDEVASIQQSMQAEAAAAAKDLITAK